MFDWYLRWRMSPEIWMLYKSIRKGEGWVCEYRIARNVSHGIFVEWFEGSTTVVLHKAGEPYRTGGYSVATDTVKLKGFEHKCIRMIIRLQEIIAEEQAEAVKRNRVLTRIAIGE